MRSFWSDPYLWIHLAGVAALPILLEICLLGLAAGDPFLPYGLELVLIAAIGIVPVLWMQWQRPFCIFSLLAVALQPAQLTLEQRKILRLFKTEESRVLALLVPALLIWILWKLYSLAPLATDVTPFSSGGRALGLLVAAIAFLAINLFLQVPVSVVPVLFTSEAKFNRIEPYPAEQVSKDFTLLGLRVKRILPDFSAETAPAVKQPKATQPVAATQSASVVESVSTVQTAPVADPTIVSEPEVAIAPPVDSVELASVTEVVEVEQSAIATNDIPEPVAETELGFDATPDSSPPSSESKPDES